MPVTYYLEEEVVVSEDEVRMTLYDWIKKAEVLNKVADRLMFDNSKTYFPFERLIKQVFLLLRDAKRVADKQITSYELDEIVKEIDKIRGRLRQFVLGE